jgi:hypothetical protein
MAADGGDNNYDAASRYAALHSMPSANIEDPIIVNTPVQSRGLHRFARLFASVTAAVLIIVLAGIVAMQNGVGDGPLASRAQSLLQNAVGDRFVAKVDGAGLRLARGGRIAIEARGVRLYNTDGGDEVVSALTVKIALHILPLLSGELSVSHIEVNGGFVDVAHLGAPGSRTSGNAQMFKVEDLDNLVDQAFGGLRATATAMENRGTRRIFLTDAIITGLGQRNPNSASNSAEREIDIKSAEITESPENGIEINSQIVFGGQEIEMNARTVAGEGKDDPQEIIGHITGLHIGSMIREFTGNPRRKFRLESSAQIDVTAKEGAGDRDASIDADIRLSAGELFMDGVAAELESSFIRLGLDPNRKSLEIKPSELNIGASSYSFNGGIIDLENLPGQSQEGYGIDLLVDNATVAPKDSSEPPVTVAMKAFGRFVKQEKRLYIDDFIISGRAGAMFSSASILFSDTSPEVSFVANIEKMDTSTVKQLWPYWIAKQARNWVHQNLFGGTVSDGSIRVFIPGGRMARALPNSLNLDQNQLQVAFNIQDARFDVAGDIPPVREADGLLALRGSRLELQIDKGKAYFPTGRTVEVSDGNFLIEHTNAIPLMAKLNIAVSGDASAVAELASYRPIRALERTPYKADDFEGAVKSKVDVTFGLIQSQNPPEPDWKVELDLGGVSVGPRIEGVKVTDAKGKMFVDPENIVFDTDASLDGITGHLNFTEPLDAASGKDPDRVVHLIMDNKDRAKLAPQLNEFIEGSIDVSAKLLGNGRQSITADLTRAKLSLPWIGWSKGKGIKASATFTMSAKADAQNENNADGARLPEDISIKDLVIKGDGFSARGKLQFEKGELASADIVQATLNRNDNFSVKIARNGSTYKIDVNGKAVDLRSSIKEFLSESEGGASDAAPGTRVEIKVKAGRATGFGNRVLHGFNMNYTGQGDTILALDLTATTANGLPVEAKSVHDGSGSMLTLKSANAGAVAGFLDIYDHVEGGTLSAKLFKAANGPYIGTVDIRDFDVVGEERLQSLVSTRSNGGKSLNQAVRRDIDVGSVHFDHAFSRIDKGHGYLKLSDGIARGPIVGFAYQGTVYDKVGSMNITGTFMPAYGLNRIFGEIPILGAILGNGRDRGLIGITFRLTGTLEDPKLEINPISVIAPGIFRNIFQFASGDGNSQRNSTINDRGR